MPSFNGKVEAISIKPLAQADTYGNVFRAGIKLGEDWYSWGSLKKEAIVFKNGNDWHTLAKGDEIEGMFKANGDFKNIQAKSVVLLSTGNPPPPPPPVGKSFPNSSSVNPAEVGQCLNLAVEVLGLDGKKLLQDDEVEKAIAWYKAVREKFSTLYPKVEALAPKPKPKPVPEEEQYDDYV